MARFVSIGFLIVLGIIWTTPAIAVCVEPPTGLIAWWTADGNSFDIAGSHNGTLVGDTSYVTGMVDEAFSFDGDADYVAIPDSASWDFGVNDFTIDMWVRFIEEKHSMFIHQQNGAVAGGFEFDYQPGLLVFGLDKFNAAIQRPWTPATSTWYHIAVTRTADVFRLYVDGNQLGSDEVDNRPVTDVTGILRIGNWQETSQFDMNGQIDELEIFDRALSNAEIQAIFSAGSDGKCKSGLVPTLSTWGMLALVLCVLVAGTVVFRRRAMV